MTEEKKKKWIVFSSLMFILGFALAMGLVGLTWLRFVDAFALFPYNQGLMTGAAIFEQEILEQCPDFNAQKISPEYYGVLISVFKEQGSDSINCWLSDTVGRNPRRQDLDCEEYDEGVKQAKEYLKSGIK